MLEFKGIFTKICLTVGWLLLSPNFGKNPFKFGVLAALATSSTAVFRLTRSANPYLKDIGQGAGFVGLASAHKTYRV